MTALNLVTRIAATRIHDVVVTRTDCVAAQFERELAPASQFLFAARHPYPRQPQSDLNRQPGAESGSVAGCRAGRSASWQGVSSRMSRGFTPRQRFGKRNNAAT